MSPTSFITFEVMEAQGAVTGRQQYHTTPEYREAWAVTLAI